MMKFNKINFGLLMLLFLCRFENILGVSDKNIEEGLKEKYKIVDLKGATLKNEQGEDFSFIVTCEYNGDYYKWFEGIESDIDDMKKGDFGKRWKMEEELKKKSGVSSVGDIVKTQDMKVLVVKDNEKENKVYLVLGTYDKGNSKTTNIYLDKSYKLRTSGPYDIEKNNTIHVMMSTDEYCGGTLIQKEVNEHKSSLYEFQIVYCELKDVKPEVSLEKLVDPSKKSIEQKDDFDKNSCCCDRLCNWCKDLCP